MPHVYQYIFEDFDPWGDFETSSRIPKEIYIVASRARRILKGRSRESLQYGAESLAWMMLGEPLDIIRERLSKVSESGDLENIETERLHPLDRNSFLNDATPGDALIATEVELVRHFIDHYDLSDQPDFPNATQSDYFALLALLIVGWVVTRDPKRRPDQYPDCGSRVRLNVLCGDLVIAMEAVCHAEHLIELDKARREGVKEFSRKGGLTSAAKFGALRNHCQQTYQKNYAHKKMSARKSGGLIYKSTPDDLKNIFPASTDDYQRIEQVARWIRQTSEYKAARKKIRN